MDLFKLTSDDSKAAKGMAVLLLLWYHLFYQHPEYGKFVHLSALQAKICVSIFLILSGYGLAKTFNPEQNIFQFYWKRLWKLYSTYWLVFLVCIPVSMIFFGYRVETVFASVKHPYFAFFAQFLGLHMYYGGLGFNPTWWFMSAIIPFYILFPFINLAIEKYGWWALAMSLICISFPGIEIPVLRTWIFPFILGVFLAKQKFSPKSLIAKYCSSLPKLLGILLIFTILSLIIEQADGKIAMLYYYFRLKVFLALAVIYFSAYLSRKISAIRHVLLIYGEHSYCIFLTHTFIYALWFPTFIYALRHPVLIMPALAVLSLLFALLVNKLHLGLTQAARILSKKFVLSGMF